MINQRIIFLKFFRRDDINPAKSLVSLRQRSNSRMISVSNSGAERKTESKAEFMQGWN